MPTKGTYAALQGAQPIKEDFGNNMVEREKLQFSYREEERLKKEAADKAQKERDDALMTDLEGQKARITGIKSVDEIQHNYFMGNSEELGSIHREMASQNLTPQRRQELIYKRAMLKKSPEMVQQLTENLANRAKAVTTGMQEGTLSKWHENELATLGALFGTDGEPMYELQNDEKGHIVANVLVGDKVEKISAVDVFQGKQMSALIKPIKQQAYTDEIVKGLGKQQELKISQGLIKTTQDFDSQRGYVNTMLDKALGTAESPTDIAKSMWTDNLGRSASDFDENSIEEIKSTLMNSIEAGYDKTVAATQLRAPSAGPRETATERRDRYQSRALYELSSLIVQGDPSALSQVGTMNRTIDGKSVTASALVPKGNSLVVVDADGVEIQTIDTTNKEAAMREVAMWVSSSDAPAEVKASFDMGMEEYGGAAPRPSGKAADATSEVVPAYDGKGIKKLNFAQRDTKAATHAISNELPEGFAVAEKKGGMFSDDKVIIMAPNSAKLELNFEKSDPEAMKQELHDFVLKNQVQEKTVYKKGESKSTNKYGI